MELDTAPIHLAQAAVHRLPDGRSLAVFWVRDDSVKFVLKGAPGWTGTLVVGRAPVEHDGLVITLLDVQPLAAGRRKAVFTVQTRTAALMNGTL